MQERTSLLATHLGIRIAEHKSYGGEEITLSRAIATHNDVVLGRKRFDNGLLLVAVQQSGRRPSFLRPDLPFEALNDYLLDIHGGLRTSRL